MKTRNSVAGIALDESGIFIARRLSGGDLGGMWEFPGGKAREGESDEDALVREFLEEFAVMVEPGDFIGETNFVHKETAFTLRAYLVRFLSADIILSVHNEWRRVSFDELLNLDFAPSDKQLFPALEQFIKNKR